MSSTAEKIKVMEAWDRGEAVEARSTAHGMGHVWNEFFHGEANGAEPSWDWKCFEYRVKHVVPPKTRFRAIKIAPYGEAGSGFLGAGGVMLSDWPGRKEFVGFGYSDSWEDNSYTPVKIAWNAKGEIVQVIRATHVIIEQTE